MSAWETALKNLKPTSVTALNQTVQQTNCAPCLKLLLDKGADINIVADGNILHTLAAFSMTREGRKTNFATGAPNMEAYGMKVPAWHSNLPDEVNGTPADMLKLLVGAGADLNALNSSDLNPLLTALGTKKAGLSKAMVEAGADVNYHPKNNGKDPASHAAEIGDPGLMKALIDKGADVNYETWDLDQESGAYCKGFTPLTRAAIHNNVECAKLIIEAGGKIKEGVSGYFSREARVGGFASKEKLLTTVTGGQLYCRYKLKNKMAIYFAIENNSMEMVQLLATSFGWYDNHQMEMKLAMDAGGMSEMHKGACGKAAGKFAPSKYAKSLGNTEIQKYLDSKGK